jgi:hypothetical protein
MDSTLPLRVVLALAIAAILGTVALTLATGTTDSGVVDWVTGIVRTLIVPGIVVSVIIGLIIELFRG